MHCRFGCVVSDKSRFACCVAALLGLTFAAITAVTVARTALTALKVFAFVLGGGAVFAGRFLCSTFLGLQVFAFWALGVRWTAFTTFTATFAAFTAALSSDFCSAFATTVRAFATRCALAQGVVCNVHGHRLGVLGLTRHGLAAFTRCALWALTTALTFTLTLPLVAAAFARGAGFTRLASFTRLCWCAFCALVAFA
jgi:hypothetical protein